MQKTLFQSVAPIEESEQLPSEMEEAKEAIPSKNDVTGLKSHPTYQQQQVQTGEFVQAEKAKTDSKQKAFTKQTSHKALSAKVCYMKTTSFLLIVI